MNQYLQKRIIEIATALRPSKETGKKFHVSFALKRNSIIGIGWNDYTKGYNPKKFGTYRNYKGYTGEYRPGRHSEVHLISKLGLDNLSEYDIVNVRISKENKPMIAMPCRNCFDLVLSPLNPKRIWYTNNEGEFELL